MHRLSILAASNSSSGGAAVIQLGIFLLIPVAMYFLLIRPQRRRQRAQAALQSAIEVGDEVMTTAGIYGFVTGFDGDIAWLEIDDNIQIRVARAAIQRKVDTAVGETGDEPSHKPDATDKGDRASRGGPSSTRSSNIDDVIDGDGN
jgi:preprotein translocase subunit YajC